MLTLVLTGSGLLSQYSWSLRERSPIHHTPRNTMVLTRRTVKEPKVQSAMLGNPTPPALSEKQLIGVIKNKDVEGNILKSVLCQT